MCFWALLNIVKIAEKCYFVVKSLGFWRVKSRLMQSLFCQGNSLFCPIFLGLFEAKRCRGRKERGFSGCVMYLSVRMLQCQGLWFGTEKWWKRRVYLPDETCENCNFGVCRCQTWRLTFANITLVVWFLPVSNGKSWRFGKIFTLFCVETQTSFCKQFS